MVAYYFTRLGWRFKCWEPSIPAGDVDLRLETPSGLVVDVQVKAPDQPGEISNGRIIGGEINARVVQAIDKAIGQLRAAPGPGRMVVVCPQRTWPLEADVLAGHLLGKPIVRSDEVWGISREGDGAFAGLPGIETSAVLALSFDRGFSFARGHRSLYRCLVVRNPWVSSSADISAVSFARARVLSLAGDKFVWEPEEPEKCFRYRTGTPLLRDGPR
jgi:hypothetical protein